MFQQWRQSLGKDCAKPRKARKETPQTSDQNPSLHTTFSINAHIPLDMWQNLNIQLEVLKLGIKLISNFLLKLFLRGHYRKSQTYSNTSFKQKTVYFRKSAETGPSKQELINEIEDTSHEETEDENTSVHTDIGNPKPPTDASYF